MKPLFEKIYFGLPVAAQNLAVSCWGYYLFRQRYSGRYSQYLKDLEQIEFLPTKTISDLQGSRFREVINHAFENVPFYQKWAREHAISPSDIRGLRDIEKLPIIEKEEIRRNPCLFVAKNYAKRRDIFSVNTSGTTGKPLNVFCDLDSRRHHYAFWSQFQGWHGISLGMRRATFGGRIGVSPDISKPPFWRYDWAQNNYLFSSYHMSEQNLDYYYSELLRIKPRQFVGYPSSLYTLAKYLITNKLQLTKPYAVFTTAETLLEHQRSAIEDAFDCKVADQYGSAEMCVFVGQCEYGTYHAHPLYGILEVLDTEGNASDEGQVGEAVCTSFVNKTMPLIRYRLGDAIRLGESKCQCGRAFPAITEIIGRVDDILISPDGRPLGRLDPVFKGMQAISETQIVQVDSHTFIIRLAKGEGFSDETQSTLLYELRKRIGSQAKIYFEFVDHVQRDKNGKFRSVISLLKD